MAEKLISKCAIVDTRISQLRNLRPGSLHLQNYAIQIVVYSKGLPGQRLWSEKMLGLSLTGLNN